MSKIAAPSAQPSSKATSPAPSAASSAWSRGPPPATDSNPASNLASGVATPALPSSPGVVAGRPLSNGNGVAQANGPAPVPIGNHSRKGSLMVGSGVEPPKTSLAFGTVDSPNPMLSSSPAAPSTTGAHLADTVKSFGSIEADSSTDPNTVKAPSRRTSTLNSPGIASPNAPAKKLDMHSLFTSKPPSAGVVSPPAQDRRPSMSQGGFPGNGQPNANPHPYGMMPGQPHLRAPPAGVMPGQSRSPVLGQAIPPGQYGQAPQIQQGFRPQQPGMMQQNATQQGMVRPNGMAPQMQPGMQRPNMMMGQPQMPYGVPQQGQYPMMGFQQGYYPGYNMYDQQQYGMQAQWAPQQHPQNQQGYMSPRVGQAQLGAPNQPSPVPPTAQLPSSGGPSPVPTPPSRPPSLIPPTHQQTPSVSSMPSTPSRPLQPTPVFTPTAGFNMSGAATAFTPTPRASKAIKFTRPDGTAVDIKQAAAAAKGPSPSVSSSGVATPEPPVAESQSLPEPPVKKVPALPVIVRIESEEQKKLRLKEEAENARLRKIEEDEEKERKARKERQAKEDEERKAKDNKEKEDAAAEEKRKMDEAFQAEQAAAKKAAEEREAVAKEQEAQDKAKAEEEVAAAHAAAQEAREKADEQRKALLTPNPSVPSSPLASPALAAAGLPAKPASAVTQSARRPASLDLKPSSPAPSDDQPSASSQALTTAKPIEDLSAIVYPSSFKPPSPELNLDAQPGKFRYDRDFLMQFMAICREKPESLPPLEEIGLEADSSSGFGSSRGARGARSSMGPPARGTGLGIGGIGRPALPGQGMGSFGMGQFGSGSITRGTTSEERYNRSLGQGRLSGMARTPSQGGPSQMPMHGLPPMAPSASRGGTNRSQRGARRLPQERPGMQLDPDVAPLAVSQNSWVKARPTDTDEKSPAFIERKVKSLLNKLTQEKFDSISNQILEYANRSREETDGMSLKLVIKLVFEKATDEAHWSAMYARLCRKLLDCLDPSVTEELEGKPVSGGTLFRKYLIGRCQMDFEAGWRAREDAATAAAAKSKEDKELLAQQEKDKAEGKEPTGEAVMLSDEYYAAQKAKRRGLGLVQLIGELYKLEMISNKVIRTCLIRLLGNATDPDEEDIESTVKLLTTIGEQFEAQSPENMNSVFARLHIVLEVEGLPSRIRFMVMDVMDQRKAGWKSRNKQAGVMTIAEIHQQAAREQAEKSAQSRESISRGGSRAGHSRRDGPQPGEWQSVATTPRPVQRPADFSRVGQFGSSSGLPSAPTFGPTSVFSKGRKPGAAGTTPPLSRQPSSTNMFNILSGESEPATTERRTSTDAESQRPKLKLQPRTKPLPGQDGEGEGGEGEGEDEEGSEEEEQPATPAEPAGMSEDAAKTKIASDMKELWGEKDMGGSRNPEDIAEYFKALPEERQPLLAERLSEDVFRIAKIKDAEVVAKGYSAALEQRAAALDVLVKGIEKRMPSLDDDAIDFPQAYKAIAILMRSISLPSDEVKRLLELVDVYGEPKITPTDKLNKAFAQLDDEAAKA